jgi:hypothetical protein
VTALEWSEAEAAGPVPPVQAGADATPTELAAVSGDIPAPPDDAEGLREEPGALAELRAEGAAAATPDAVDDAIPDPGLPGDGDTDDATPAGTGDAGPDGDTALAVDAERPAP